MMFPYEHEPEFIRVNAEIQSRFLQATHLSHRTGQPRLPACCAKLRDKAELHRYYLKSKFPAPSDWREYLRTAINDEAFKLFADTGPDYPKLEAYRDALLREMVGDAVEGRGDASPSSSASVDRVEAEARSVKRIEPVLRRSNRNSAKKPGNARQAYRRKIFKDFILDHDLDGMTGLAQRVNSDVSALHGMVREDRKKYSNDRLESVLAKIGCPRARWDQLPTPPPGV